MTTVSVTAWICLLSPLAAAVLIALAGNRLTRRGAGYLATTSTFVSFGAALVGFLSLLGEHPEERSDVTTAWTWLKAGSFEAGLSLLVDPLSMLMMLIVSGVGSLIVMYSIGYMDGEDEERRYFAYMAIFVFSMLLLVESANLVLLLAGWGLVGLASYLLIGFHHERPSAIAAAKKAFVMNAVGDATMALAIFLLWWKTGTVDFDGVFGSVDGLSNTVVTLAALGLLGGAIAKSAQLPLHTWLPDAMEGPTPVSALIHAATMVTAGVYLLVRLHPIYEAADFVQHLAAAIGAVTLVVAGLIALVQTDIKRVIAYSTMSQIGYMFLGAGIGAYGERDVPPDDARLLQGAALPRGGHHHPRARRRAGHPQHGRPARRAPAHVLGDADRRARARRDLPALGLLVEGLDPGVCGRRQHVRPRPLRRRALRRLPDRALHVPDALPRVRRRALARTRASTSTTRATERRRSRWAGPSRCSSVLSVIGGFVQIPGVWTPFADWLEPVAPPLVEPTVTQDWVTSLVSVSIALGGIWLAYLIWSRRSVVVPESPDGRRVLEHKFYFDELYDRLFYEPAVAIARALRRGVEEPVVTGSIDATVTTVREASRASTLVQTGFLRSYALALMAGLAVLAVVFVALR